MIRNKKIDLSKYDSLEQKCFILGVNAEALPLDSNIDEINAFNLGLEIKDYANDIFFYKLMIINLTSSLENKVSFIKNYYSKIEEVKITYEIMKNNLKNSYNEAKKIIENNKYLGKAMNETENWVEDNYIRVEKETFRSFERLIEKTKDKNRFLLCEN